MDLGGATSGPRLRHRGNHRRDDMRIVKEAVRPALTPVGGPHVVKGRVWYSRAIAGRNAVAILLSMSQT